METGKNNADGRGPLAGVRVVDASRVLAGPFCGQVLGDLGAEVIKIERPGQGDDTRAWGPPFLGSVSAYFLSCNRNKRGVTRDLGREEGRELFRGLVGKSDIVLENFRAESVEKLGLGAAQLLSINPRLILCSISGYGRTGPRAPLPGYDFAVQALSGLMSGTGPVEGPPCKVSVAVTDIVTGLYAAVAVLACLHARKQSGHGYAIDLALLDCAVAAQVNLVQAFLTNGRVPPRQGNGHFQIVPYQVFATADGWLALAVGNDAQYRRFCTAAGLDHLAADERFRTNALRVQNRSILVPILEELFSTRSTGQWEAILLPAEVPHAPVWDYAQLFADPQMAARGMRLTVRDPKGQPVDLVGSPFHIAGSELPPPSMPPGLGQDTEAVLRELLGVDAGRLEGLRKAGIV